MDNPRARRWISPNQGFTIKCDPLAIDSPKPVAKWNAAAAFAACLQHRLLYFASGKCHADSEPDIGSDRCAIGTEDFLGRLFASVSRTDAIVDDLHEPLEL